MKKLLDILEGNYDCFIRYTSPNSFIVYKEKPKYPNDPDYMNVVTLFEGDDFPGRGFAPSLTVALATMIGLDIDSIEQVVDSPVL